MPLAMAISEPWSTKTSRRTREQMAALRDAIKQILEPQHPQADRQLFYAMSCRGLIPKDERDYKNVVIRLCGQMREAGELPWEWITDGTRWMRKPVSYSSKEEALDWCVRTYRRAVWADQDAYVEVWIEKEALAGMVYPITSEFDVPLMPVKGFPSKAFVHDATEAILERGKPAYIYYFGDWDPSGLMIGKDIEAKLARYAPGADITFEWVAVTREQITLYDLPTRPTKRDHNTHAKNFHGDSVELDALPVEVLRGLVRASIEQHINPWQWEITKLAEESEREALRLVQFGKTKKKGRTIHE